MPAVRITSSWPTAMMPKIATWRARLAMLSAVRNSSESSVIAPNRTSRTMSPPASRPNTSPNVRTRSGRTAAGAAAARGACDGRAAVRSVRWTWLRFSWWSGAGAGELEDVFFGRAAGGQLAGDRALPHHDDAVREAEDLGQVRRHDDDAEPAAWRGRRSRCRSRPWRPRRRPWWARRT